MWFHLKTSLECGQNQTVSFQEKRAVVERSVGRGCEAAAKEICADAALTVAVVLSEVNKIE